MADIKIIDIDNEQWNIKDQEARNNINTLQTRVENLENKSFYKNIFSRTSPGNISFTEAEGGISKVIYTLTDITVDKTTDFLVLINGLNFNITSASYQFVLSLYSDNTNLANIYNTNNVENVNAFSSAVIITLERGTHRITLNGTTSGGKNVTVYRGASRPTIFFIKELP